MTANFGIAACNGEETAYVDVNELFTAAQALSQLLNYV